MISPSTEEVSVHRDGPTNPQTLCIHEALLSIWACIPGVVLPKGLHGGEELNALSQGYCGPLLLLRL